MPATAHCTSSSCGCGASQSLARPRRLPKLAGAALLLGTFPLVRVMTPLLLRDALPICPFRCATGKPCPLCGLTRAFAVATHGRWGEAFGFNPLWPLFAGLTILFSLLLVIDAVARRESARHLGRAITDRWIWVLSALLVFGGWRIVVS